MAAFVGRIITAAVGPAVTDDSSKGMQQGYMWYDTVTATFYICTDPGTVGNALWQSFTATALGAVTPGTVAASKAVVVDANKDIGAFRNITAAELDGVAANQGVAIVVKGGTSATAANAGGAVTITGGTAGATGVGGAVNATSGAGGATSGASGGITIASGTTTAGSGSATGNILFQSGAGATSAAAVAGGASGTVTVRSQAGGTNTGGAAGQVGGAGGLVTISGGAGGTTNSQGAHDGGAGGGIAITAGAGGAASAGTGNGGAGGTLALTTGAGATSAGGTNSSGGNLTIITGQAGGASGSAGSISADCGAANGGTVGTITIGGTNAGAINVGRSGQTVVQKGITALVGVGGTADSYQKFVVPSKSCADGAATDLVTVTIPNANHSAGVKVTLIGRSAGTDAYESTRVAEGFVAVARTTGANAVAVAATLELPAIATVAGGDTFTMAYSVTGIVGAVGDPNTFTIAVTLNSVGNQACSTMAVVEVFNVAATGVTAAAA